MAHLSSCYFCGTALKSPVQTYELSGGTGGSRTTVSLCSSCKEKLDTVLDSAGRGTLGPAGDVTEPEQDVDTDDRGERSEDGEPGDREPIRTEAETNSSERVEADSDNSPDASTESDELEAHQETASGGPFDGGSEGLAAEDESFGDDGIDEAVDAIDGEELDDAFEDDELLPEADPLAEDGNEDPLAGETESKPTDEGTGESSDRSSNPDDQADEAGAQTPTGTTISALEYNRVMRMLQNREFPIDREEIVLVASNAYDLAQSECNQVIDLAVDRGLLDDRDGELYRPADQSDS